MMPAFAEIFHSLTGRWRLARTISSGESFEGEMRVSQSDETTLLVTETGELRTPGGDIIAAHRNWLWCCDGATLKICFDEKPLRIYHQLKPNLKNGLWIGEAVHQCPPDTYGGHYEIAAQQIIIRQSVTGHRKDYSIVSEYSRSAGAN